MSPPLSPRHRLSKPGEVPIVRRLLFITHTPSYYLMCRYKEYPNYFLSIQSQPWMMQACWWCMTSLRGLVRMSPSCFSDGFQWIGIIPLFFCMNCTKCQYLTLMCFFVRRMQYSCAMAIAPWLSSQTSHKILDSFMWTLSDDLIMMLFITWRRNIASLVEVDNAASSASVDESVISPYSLHPQVNGTPAYMMANPVRDQAVWGSYIAWSLSLLSILQQKMHQQTHPLID